MTVALVAAFAAILGALITTGVTWLNSRSQRQFEIQKAIREKQRESYSGLLLTLEETMGRPTLEQVSALQRAVLLVVMYGEVSVAKSADAYFRALIGSQQGRGAPLTREQHQQHHESILTGIRASLGLPPLPGFQLVQIPREV